MKINFPQNESVQPATYDYDKHTDTVMISFGAESKPGIVVSGKASVSLSARVDPLTGEIVGLNLIGLCKNIDNIFTTLNLPTAVKHGRKIGEVIA